MPEDAKRQGIVDRQFGTHVRGNPLVLFNVWDAGSAKAVARAGAKAIATSSLSVADANGSADGEHLPRTIAIENLRRIVAATDLPVTVDLESGYGETVGETVALAVDAGAAGCNLEDSIPGSGTLREIADQCERIRSARRRGLAFFINARTDVFFQQPAEQHNDEMLAEAVERAKAYAEAGADGIFAPGLGDIGLIARLARESPLPLNIMLGGNAPPLRVFTEVGVARISYGPQPYLIAMKALENAAREAVVETC